MQKVAAYLLERRAGLESSDDRGAEATRIRGQVDQWLLLKGGVGSADTGTYVAEDGSRATWRRARAVDADRSWSLLQLDEVTDDGRRVSAIASTTVTEAGVAVYTTLEIGSESSGVKVVEADPRCPRVVRDLLEGPGPWHHGATLLQPLRRVHGFGEGVGIADELVDPARTIPIVVVTDGGSEPALPYLDEKLGYDLSGLANVVRLDADATWALTDALGTPLSCFAGAVRVYWPGVTAASDPYRHPLWTSARLLASSDDARTIRDRFRRQLRGLVMRASALSAVRPSAIDDIRNAATRRVYAELTERATTLAEFRELAESYARENDALQRRITRLEKDLADLEVHLAGLVGERDALRLRSESAERRNRELEDEIAAEGEAGEEPAPPKHDEVRFYKKRHDTRTHDVFVRVPDCDHNRWQNANRADKAWKGVARLEGRDDWRTFQRCGACTGGGMWRVRW